MATSLFFWFWSVRNETVDSLQHEQLLRDHSHQHSAAVALAAARDDAPYPTNLTGGPKGNRSDETSRVPLCARLAIGHGILFRRLFTFQRPVRDASLLRA